MRWTEVTEDTVGFPIALRHYVVEVQYSANDTDWFDSKRTIVSAKFDGDDGTKAHLIMRRIHPKLYYRFRVRAVARDGCKSAWSSYEDVGNPGTDEPPAPTNVKIKRGHNGIRLRWTATDDPADADLIHDDIAFFVAELHDADDFTNLIDRKRFLTHHQCMFPVHCLPSITADLDLLLIDLEMSEVDGAKVLAYAVSKGIDRNRIIIFSGHEADYLHKRFPPGSCLGVLDKFEAKQQEALDMIFSALQRKGADEHEDTDSSVEIPIDGTLHLHTFRPDEVSGVVREYVSTCRERGIVQVRIIHGKGIGTLRDIVHAGG